MKRILAFLLVLALACTAVFANEALDFVGAAADSFPTGKWLDEKWGGVWEFGVGNSLKLWDTENNLIFDFARDKVQDLKLVPDAVRGLVLSFYCPETERAYKFVKPLTAGTDLELTVNPDWTDEDYITTIKFQ